METSRRRVDLYFFGYLVNFEVMTISKSDPIIILGAGAFGLSTALHLSEAGYTNITVLDKGKEVPSGYSAANDVNKILRAEYEDRFYTDLAIVSRSHTTSIPVDKFPE